MKRILEALVTICLFFDARLDSRVKQTRKLVQHGIRPMGSQPLSTASVVQTPSARPRRRVRRR
jgi:hypothetical protein